MDAIILVAGFLLLARKSIPATKGKELRGGPRIALGLIYLLAGLMATFGPIDSTANAMPYVVAILCISTITGIFFAKPVSSSLQPTK